MVTGNEDKEVITLFDGFQEVAQVHQGELLEIFTQGGFGDCLGRYVDPYRTLRGPGVGSPGPL